MEQPKRGKLEEVFKKQLFILKLIGKSKTFSSQRKQLSMICQVGCLLRDFETEGHKFTAGGKKFLFFVFIFFFFFSV